MLQGHDRDLLWEVSPRGLTLQVLDDADVLGLGDGPQHTEGGLLPKAAAVLPEAGGGNQQRLELIPCEEALQPLRLAADVEQHLRGRRKEDPGDRLEASLLPWTCSLLLQSTEGTCQHRDGFICYHPLPRPAWSPVPPAAERLGLSELLTAVKAGVTLSKSE